MQRIQVNHKSKLLWVNNEKLFLPLIDHRVEDSKKEMQVIKRFQVIENLHLKSRTQILGQVILV